MENAAFGASFEAMKSDHLPRQARDKQKEETLTERGCFSAGVQGGNGQRGGGLCYVRISRCGTRPFLSHVYGKTSNLPSQALDNGVLLSGQHV